MSKQWYVGRDQKQSGPYSWEELVEKAKSGEVGKSDLVWSEGLENWIAAEKVEGLFTFSADSPPPIPSGNNTPTLPPAFNTGRQVNEKAAPYVDMASSTELPKKKSGLKIALIVLASLIALVVIFFVVIFASVRSTLRSSEVYAQSMSILHSNPEAVQMLGSPVEAGKAVNGEINVSNGSGDAELSIPVSGSISKGELQSRGLRTEGQWSLTLLELVMENGERINLLVGLPQGAQKEQTLGQVDIGAGSVTTEIEDLPPKQAGGSDSTSSGNEMLLFGAPGYGFNMSYPADWDCFPVHESRQVTFFPPEYSEDGGVSVGVQIMYSKNAGGFYGSLNEIAEEFERLYIGAGGEVVERENDKILLKEDLHGGPGEPIAFDYEYILSYYPYEGVDYMEFLVIIERNSDYFYLLQYSAPIDVENDYSDLVFDQMFDSLVFIPFN